MNIRTEPSPAAIISVIEQYFDALYEGDADAFSRILHPTARLFCATKGTVSVMDVQPYLDLVRSRPAPAASKERRNDRILGIDCPTPTTAHVRVCELFGPRQFVDELTLLYAQGEWRIVAKVWHEETDGNHA